MSNFFRDTWGSPNILIKTMKENALLEEASVEKDEKSTPIIEIEAETTEPPKPIWLVHQVMRYLLPTLKE
jgi:hypothetical protein